MATLRCGAFSSLWQFWLLVFCRVTRGVVQHFLPKQIVGLPFPNPFRLRIGMNSIGLSALGTTHRSNFINNCGHSTASGLDVMAGVGGGVGDGEVASDRAIRRQC